MFVLEGLPGHVRGGAEAAAPLAAALLPGAAAAWHKWPLWVAQGLTLGAVWSVPKTLMDGLLRMAA